jgi:hypothetical protein
MRALGFTTSRTGRVLRDVCDELGVDYTHFQPRGRQTEFIEEAVRRSSTWAEVIDRVGSPSDLSSALIPRPHQLRHAGPYLVAAALTLAGVAVSFAPEGVAYDLIGDFPRLGPQRIQVKTVTSGVDCRLLRKEYFRDGHGGHRRALYSAEDIDYFACVALDQTIHLIPIAAVEGKGSVSLRKYDAYRLPVARAAR